MDYAIAEELRNWQERLAAEAEAGIATDSLDMLEAIGELIERGASIVGEHSELGSWRFSWERFKKAPLVEKILALWTVVRRRCPPWEFRMAVRGFVLLGAIQYEVITRFVIDRPHKLVKVLKFELGESLDPGHH